jgi:hypothetical protein
MKSLNRNKLGRRIAPGIWEDADGHVHWSIPELLSLVGLDDTPENQQAARRIIEESLRKTDQDVVIVHRHTRED